MHRGTSLGQSADHDGADGRKILRHERRAEVNGPWDDAWHAETDRRRRWPATGALTPVVLSCAAVGFHSRDTFALSCGVVTIGLTALCTTVGAQPPASYVDLTSDIAAKIAAALTPGSATSVVALDSDAGTAPVQREVTRALAARGFRIVSPEAGPAAVVRLGCGENLRERVCLAEISRGEARDIVAAAKPHGVRSPDDPAEDNRTLAIEATPVFGQRAPILDIAVVDDRLVVLDPSAVTLYRRAAGGWARSDSRAISPARTWPRDVRGRLRVSAANVEAFLPATLCRAPLDMTSLSCVEQREPWPLAVENSGLDGIRNAFHTPQGLSFYSAASLTADADARAALVDSTGNVVLMAESRALTGRIGSADDVAGLTVECRKGAFILASSSRAGDPGDTLRLWQIVSRRAIAAATPLTFPGKLTALWSAEGATVATAVVHDAGAERYEAFQIRAACDR
jgi:hypothetical protein